MGATRGGALKLRLPPADSTGMGREPARVALSGLVAALLVSLAVPAAAARRSAATCQAACRDRNVPASCGWLSPEPRRCLERALRACEHDPIPGRVECPPP